MERLPGVWREAQLPKEDPTFRIGGTSQLPGFRRLLGLLISPPKEGVYLWYGV